jgi:Flp pilus assembly protein TadG
MSISRSNAARLTRFAQEGAPRLTRFARENAPRLTRFAHDVAGVTAVEFGLIAPMFFVLLFMLCQVGLYMYYSASLSYATNGAARQIMTGAVAQTANISAGLFRTQFLCPLLPGAMSCNNVVTNVITVPANGSFYGLPAPQMDNTKTKFNVGNPGCYVILQVYYAMPVVGIPPMLSGAINFNGTPSLFINSNTVFVNEPYKAGAATC